MKKVMMALIFTVGAFATAQAQTKTDKNCNCDNDSKIKVSEVMNNDLTNMDTDEVNRKNNVVSYSDEQGNMWYGFKSKENADSKIVVTYDDAQDPYEGEESLQNDGVQNTIQRNINYNNPGTHVPPNDGGVSNNNRYR